MKRTFTVMPKSKITATTYADSGYPVFMLMYYSPGYEGMESDDFGCVGKFFGNENDTVKSLNAELDTMKGTLLPKDCEAFQHYVEDYNEYFDDGSEVYQNLDTVVRRNFDMNSEYNDYLAHFDEFGW